MDKEMKSLKEQLQEEISGWVDNREIMSVDRIREFKKSVISMEKDFPDSRVIPHVVKRISDLIEEYE